MNKPAPSTSTTTMSTAAAAMTLMAGSEQIASAAAVASTNKQQQQRGKARKCSAATTYCLELNQNDVLLGRGTGANDHQGNIDFRTLIKQTQAEYTSAKVRGEKTRIARRVIATVQKQFGGRFLRKLTPGEARKVPGSSGNSVGNEAEAGTPPAKSIFAVVVDDNTLVQKTKQAFRHLIRQNGTAGPTTGDGAAVAVAAAPTSPGKAPLLNSSSSNSMINNSRLSPIAPAGDASFLSRQVNHRVTPERMIYEPNMAFAAAATSSLNIPQVLNSCGPRMFPKPTFAHRHQHPQHRNSLNMHSNASANANANPASLSAASWLQNGGALNAAASAFCNNQIANAAAAGLANPSPLSLVETLVAAQRDLNDARLRQDAYLLKLIAEKDASLALRQSSTASASSSAHAPQASTAPWSRPNASAADSMAKSAAAAARSTLPYPGASSSLASLTGVPTSQSNNNNNNNNSSSSHGMGSNGTPTASAPTSAARPQPKMSDILQAALSLSAAASSSPARSTPTDMSQPSSSNNNTSSNNPNANTAATPSSNNNNNMLLQLLKAENSLHGFV
mmetsp:Transcript_8356/g.24053  ORF Transcript_8356/g.24053 Transcript_8356/m.24053 type:complete len:562 (-) Transcript_8356:64-1749(-)